MDVAARSGFSASTVSIVLNDRPLARNLAAQTRLSIHAAAEALGYKPDIFAQSLRRQRSHTIGVMIFDISDPFCMLILRGMELELDPTPYLPIIMDAHNERKQFDRYLDMLLERRVEGLIIVANWLFDGIESLPEVARAGIPISVVGRDLSRHKIPSIVVDNEAGGYCAIKHLYELGHREIAFVRGPRNLLDSTQRWAGVKRFAREHGLTLHPQLTAQLAYSTDPASTFEGGLELTESLLAAGRKFTALMAFDDMAALGAARALHTRGIEIPRDCSLIGFDDIPVASLATPGLTTIQQPMREMGLLATKRMLGLLEKEAQEPSAKELQTLLAPALVIRGSSAPLTYLK